MEKKETNGGGNEPQQPVQPNQPNRPNGKKRFNLMWVYAILAIVLIAVNFFGRGSAVPQEEIDQGKLKELLQNQEISKIELITKKACRSIFLMHQRREASHRDPTIPIRLARSTVSRKWWRLRRKALVTQCISVM